MRNLGYWDIDFLVNHGGSNIGPLKLGYWFCELPLGTNVLFCIDMSQMVETFALSVRPQGWKLQAVRLSGTGKKRAGQVKNLENI